MSGLIFGLGFFWRFLCLRNSPHGLGENNGTNMLKESTHGTKKIKTKKKLVLIQMQIHV